jgi:Putative beta barrel porin-7 (BBP7)
MRSLGAATLILTLLGFLGDVAADEISWRPARPSPLPPGLVALQPIPCGISLGKPVPADAPRAAPMTGVSLVDPALLPASFCAPAATVVRAKAEDIESAAPPAPLTELDAVGLASAPDLVEEPAGKGPSPAPIPAFHEVDHAVFPQVATHWTRTIQAGPGSEFAPLPPGEDAGEPGPPEVASSRFYASGEYLLWWTKGAVLPPLVTTGTTTSQGILGQPGTVILFGGSTVDYGPQSGGRFTAGYWLDCDQTMAIEGSLFFLGQGTVPFAANSAAFPVLARPIVALNPPVAGESRELAAFPGLFSGAINASTASRLWGTEVNARCKGCCGCLDDCTYRIDWLAGVRYLELNDNLSITEALQFQPGVIPTLLPNGGTGFVFDSFGTRNQFVGAQVGTVIELCHGRWFLDVKGKLAIGDTHETVNINGGQQLFSAAGLVAAFPGGLLAQPSNIGRFTRDSFGVIPEVGLQLGYQVTDHFRVTVGYNFLFWSDVLRAGEQVDRNIDLTQVPAVFQPPGIVPVGQTRPAVLFRETSYWAQGLTAGLEWRY